MEAVVKESIYSGSVDDPSLALLLNLSAKEILSQRYMFPNPLDEPVFYSRYFKRWVEEGIKSLRMLNEKEKEK